MRLFSTNRLPPGWSLGPILLVLGILAFGLAPQPGRQGLGENHDPGPRAVPVVLALGLIAGGIAEIVKTWLMRRRTTPSAHGAKAIGTDVTESNGVESLGDAAVVLLLVVVYVATMPWLGFSLGTALFVVGLLLRLGARWITATTAAVVLVLTVRLLFVGLFRVQLPVGELGLPF
jgi:hypothetical protein